jgi:hypothetical protein
MPYVGRSNNTERPIAIVDTPGGTSRRWQHITIHEAKHLVADLQAAISEHELRSPLPLPPRPQPKHDSGVWERRAGRKWRFWRMYEGGRS